MLFSSYAVYSLDISLIMTKLAEIITLLLVFIREGS